MGILDWLNQYLFETVWCAVRRAWCWVMDVVIGWGEFILGKLSDAWPELPSHAGELNAAADYLGLVNAWLPFVESFVIVSLLVGWTLVRVVVGWVLKLVPGLGG